MLPRLRSLRPLDIYRINLPRQQIATLRPSPTFSQRAYARYSRFDDDNKGSKGGGDPNDPEEKESRRKFEAFRTYGTSAVVVGGDSKPANSLEQVPETKRWRYMDTSPAMVKLLEKESYTQLMSELGRDILPPNHKATRWVQAVAEKLITKNGLGHVIIRSLNSPDEQKPDEWLVYVVDRDVENAFVMPGRKIVVFTGMLRQVEDEDQIAGILAHEVAHQLVGHVLERVSLTRLLVILDFTIQFLLGTHTNLAGIVLQAFIELPNSRKQELEADLIGLRLMSKACFEPEAVVKFWHSFEKKDKYQPPQFLSTHPGHTTRAKAIESWISAIRSEYPCVDMVNFASSYQQQSIRDPTPFPAVRTPEPALHPVDVPSRGRSPHSGPVPSRAPSPDVSDWDPWAQGSSGSDGGSGLDEWGGKDPWEEKNRGRNKRGSW